MSALELAARRAVDEIDDAIGYLLDSIEVSDDERDITLMSVMRALRSVRNDLDQAPMIDGSGAQRADGGEA